MVIGRSHITNNPPSADLRQITKKQTTPALCATPPKTGGENNE